MQVHKIDYGQRVYQGTLDAIRQVIIATMLVIDSYNGETIGEPWISDRDEYVAGATPSTGAQVAYTLDEPLEIPVTVSNLPIKSLSGYNHIESSTGEMEIEYFPAKEQPLIDLIPEASNMHEYSTAEHAVGTWIDGETIYEQTYTYSGIGAANPFQTTIDMTGKNLIEVIQHYARYTYNSGESYGECVGAELIYSNCNTLNVRYVDSAPYTLTVSSFLGNATESYDIAFTLRYTKQSTRSLAKSAPQEETKEEQVEGLKEEPTEEIKEELEEIKEEETKEEGEVNER